MHEEAIALRESLRFKKVVKKNEYADGRIDAVREPFKYFASTNDIAAVSAGVGLYFKTLWHFFIIMVATTALAVWPIISNIRADNTTEEYPLTVINSDVPFSETICDKTYEVRPCESACLCRVALDLWLHSQCGFAGDKLNLGNLLGQPVPRFCVR